MSSPDLQLRLGAVLPPFLLKGVLSWVLAVSQLSQADTELETCATNPACKATTGMQHCEDSLQRAAFTAFRNLPIPTLGHHR